VKTLRDVVDACKRSGRLTPWEEDFVEHIEDVLDLGRDLTMAQEEKLDQIYEERAR
jgi:hypothetical protein